MEHARERGGRYLFQTMTHTTTVSLPPPEVLARATFLNLRGQGGEELVISAWEDKEKGVTRVRASTLFFDQGIDRFFSTLPLASAVEVA